MPNGGTHDTDGGGGDRRLTYPRMSREQEMHNARARLALAEREEYLKTRKWRESALFGAGPETMTSRSGNQIVDYAFGRVDNPIDRHISSNHGGGKSRMLAIEKPALEDKSPNRHRHASSHNST